MAASGRPRPRATRTPRQSFILAAIWLLIAAGNWYQVAWRDGGGLSIGIGILASVLTVRFLVSAIALRKADAA